MILLSLGALIGGGKVNFLCNIGGNIVVLSLLFAHSARAKYFTSQSVLTHFYGPLRGHVWVRCWSTSLILRHSQEARLLTSVNNYLVLITGLGRPTICLSLSGARFADCGCANWEIVQIVVRVWDHLKQELWVVPKEVHALTPSPILFILVVSKSYEDGLVCYLLDALGLFMLATLV